MREKTGNTRRGMRGKKSKRETIGKRGKEGQKKNKWRHLNQTDKVRDQTHLTIDRQRLSNTHHQTHTIQSHVTLSSSLSS